jgi:hypothetical protein
MAPLASTVRAVPLRIGVFLITLSGLVFEIALTRIYSATIWYHFTFIAVSIALLGWGLGGFAVHMAKKRWTPSFDAAGLLCAGYAATMLLTLAAVVHFPFTLDRMAMYFVAPLLPFLLAGMALSTIFDLRRESAATLYFADLVGASLGAVIVTLLLQTLGGESTVILAAAAPLVAAACLSRRLRLAGIVAAGAVSVLAFTNESTGWFRVIPGSLKAMRRQMDEQPSTRVAQTGWNAYSRIDAVEGFPAPNLARLYIDSDAWTNIHTWDGNLDSVRDMRTWYRALPFRFEPDARTLIIGPGGGPDVLAALAAGSRKVTAVELNPLMLQFVRHYGARAGNIYDRPDVEVIQSEGRNFISRTDRTFDVILLGFVDSWASVASGGLSLSENHLYTTEAFKAYYDHLSDGGMLVVIRWISDVPRLVANSVALLGAEQASTRVVSVLENREGEEDNQTQMIFMLRKRPFTAAETGEIMTDWTLARPVIVPGRHVESPYDRLLSGQQTLEEWDATSPTRIGAVSDDSPFYFANERPFGMATRLARMLLRVLVYPVAVLLALFILLGKPRGAATRPYAASILYFCALGFGFIAVELALLQNLTLLLGHPIFTLSVLLFTLLAAGGLGSAVSRHVPIPVACLIVAGVGTADALILPRLVPMLLPLSLSARVAIAIALVAPLGLAMGMPFPRGLQKAGRGPLPAPPFYWGLNGTMSVIGSIATVFMALAMGFQAAMLMGSACYVLAAIAAPAMD